MHLEKLTDNEIVVNEEAFNPAEPVPGAGYSSPTPSKWVIFLKLR